MAKQKRQIQRCAQLVGGVLILTLLASCSNPFNSNQSTAPQRTATVTKGTLVATVNATGSIQPESEVRLTFPSAGKVAEVRVSRGDPVETGDVLAKLDTADLEIALAQTQAGLAIATANYSRTIEGPRSADVKAAQAALAAANSNYSKLKGEPESADIAAAEAAVLNAEAALRQAQTAHDFAYRVDPANYPGSPTIAQLEQARNNLEAAKLQYDKVARGTDKAQLSTALQQVLDARARLEQVQQPVQQYDIDQAAAERRRAEVQVQQAQRRLEQAMLVAPSNGVIAAVNMKAGEIAAAQSVITLVNTSPLHIDITIDEIDIARVKPDQEVSVTLDALPEVELKGYVDRVAPSSTTVNGVVSYLIRVVMDDTNPSLRPGMTANASIVLEKHENVLLAPNWAIRRDRQSGKAFVTLQVDDKTTQEVEVKIGLRNESVSEILSGLNEGQTIVAPQAPNLLGQ
jgi:HlyD family secretion protein